MSNLGWLRLWGYVENGMVTQKEKMEFKSLKKGGTTILSISWRVPRILIPAASAVRDDLPVQAGRQHKPKGQNKIESYKNGRPKYYIHN